MVSAFPRAHHQVSLEAKFCDIRGTVFGLAGQFLFLLLFEGELRVCGFMI